MQKYQLSPQQLEACRDVHATYRQGMQPRDIAKRLAARFDIRSDKNAVDRMAGTRLPGG